MATAHEKTRAVFCEMCTGFVLSLGKTIGYTNHPGPIKGQMIDFSLWQGGGGIYSLVGILLEMFCVRLAFLTASSGSHSPRAILKWTDRGKSPSPSGLEGEGWMGKCFEVKIAKLKARVNLTTGDCYGGFCFNALSKMLRGS